MWWCKIRIKSDEKSLQDKRKPRLKKNLATESATSLLWILTWAKHAKEYNIKIFLMKEKNNEFDAYYKGR